MLFALGCTEEVSLLSSETETPVVEAYIFANESIDSIRVTKSISYSGDGVLENIDNLEITISDGVEDIRLDPIGNGYYSKLDYIVEEDKTYTLEFDYEGRTIMGTTYVLPSKDISFSRSSLRLEKIEFNGPGQGGGPGLLGQQEIVEVSWNNSENNYYFVDVKIIEDDPEYVNGLFDFLEEQDIELPQQFFRSEPDIVDFYTLDTRRELQFFGTYEVIVFDQLGNSDTSDVTLIAPKLSI